FWSSVRGLSSVSDPHVRFDPLSDRWFAVTINVEFPANRILIAVSNAATITSATAWTFYGFKITDPTPTGDANCLADYPTPGIEANALYVGVNNCCGATLNSASFTSTAGYVVRKSSILNGPLVVTVFRGLVPSPFSAGPVAPQGVDNYDPAATQGYFVG